MRVKLAPFCNFRGLFSKKGGPKNVFELIGTDGRFAAILEHSGLELLQNCGCLSGEIMTQTKKRKAIETVSDYKCSKYVYREAVKSVLLSVMVSNNLFPKK